MQKKYPPKCLTLQQLIALVTTLSQSLSFTHVNIKGGEFSPLNIYSYGKSITAVKSRVRARRHPKQRVASCNPMFFWLRHHFGQYFKTRSIVFSSWSCC